MMTLEQRQEAASDVTATLMDWFPHLTGLECERIAKLAVAACDRAVDIEQRPYWWDGSKTRPPTADEFAYWQKITQEADERNGCNITPPEEASEVQRYDGSTDA